MLLARDANRTSTNNPHRKDAMLVRSDCDRKSCGDDAHANFTTVVTGEAEVCHEPNRIDAVYKLRPRG